MPGNAALAEMPSKTLYDVEDDLLALLDSEDGVTAEMEAQFKADLAQVLTGAKEKRERVARKILQLEAAAAYAHSEAKRCAVWARVRENKAERLRAYVLGVIEGLDRDKKGKLQKLEGLTTTMSARACPASLEITDAGIIPEEYKTVTVIMPARDWSKLREAAGAYCPTIPAITYGVISAKLKAAIEGGAEVPGADLAIGKNTLQVK